MPFNTEEFNKLIKTRRSIFPALYSGKVVDDEIISQMLENANWAPSHKFTEPWRFTVFKGEGLKKLGRVQSEVYRKVTEADGTFKQHKFENLRDKPLSASHVIVIGMHRDPKNSVPEVEEIAAVACAVQNMYLTAAAYGVGCYWGTGGITYFDEAKAQFDLAPEDRLMGFFYVGSPAKWPEPSKRKAIEEKVSWVKD